MTRILRRRERRHLLLTQQEQRLLEKVPQLCRSPASCWRPQGTMSQFGHSRAPRWLKDSHRMGWGPGRGAGPEEAQDRFRCVENDGRALGHGSRKQKRRQPTQALWPWPRTPHQEATRKKTGVPSSLLTSLPPVASAFWLTSCPGPLPAQLTRCQSQPGLRAVLPAQTPGGQREERRKGARDTRDDARALFSLGYAPKAHPGVTISTRPAHTLQGGQAVPQAQQDASRQAGRRRPHLLQPVRRPGCATPDRRPPATPTRRTPSQGLL